MDLRVAKVDSEDQQAHSSHMQFKCEFCDRMFENKVSHHRHVRAHMREPTFRNSKYGMAIPRSNHLQDDMQMHDSCPPSVDTAIALDSDTQNHETELRKSLNSPLLMDASSLRRHAKKCLEKFRQEAQERSEPTPGNFCRDNIANADTLKSHEEKSYPSETRKNRMRYPAYLSPSTSPPYYKQIHEDMPPAGFSCKRCNQKEFPTSHSLIKHIRDTHIPTINIKKSPSMASTSSPLNSPRTTPDTCNRKCNEPPGNSYDCFCCPLKFRKFFDLREHCVTVHKFRDSYFTLSESTAFDSASLNLTWKLTWKTYLDSIISKRFYICSECDGKFLTQETLERHVAKHCLSNSVGFDYQSCTKTYCKPEFPRRHLLNAHSQKLYQCTLCAESFASTADVQLHMSMQHNDSSFLYKCTSCSSIFESEIEINLHFKMEHLTILHPFRCYLCNLCFPSESMLYSHFQSHRWFPCRFCREEFHIEFLLERHIQNKHPGESFPSLSHSEADTVKTWHSCCVCGRENAIDELILTGTQKNHSYMCNGCFHVKHDNLLRSDCKIKLQGILELKKHKLFHRNNYLCSKCEMFFETEEELQAHLNIHVIQNDTDTFFRPISSNDIVLESRGNSAEDDVLESSSTLTGSFSDSSEFSSDMEDSDFGDSPLSIVEESPENDVLFSESSYMI